MDPKANMATSMQSKNEITLRGSTSIVTEFFGYCVNSILYQRGIYPPDSFETVQKYGLQMVVTKDDALKNYVGNVLQQLAQWLMEGVVQRLVLVIQNAENNDEVLERWQFNIDADVRGQDKGEYPQKGEKEIQSEIQAIIRQVTASVTFLPLLDCACSFDMLVYTHKDVETPGSWEESDGKTINNCSEVRLRQFTTKVHNVNGTVAFKVEDE